MGCLVVRRTLARRHTPAVRMAAGAQAPMHTSTPHRADAGHVNDDTQAQRAHAGFETGRPGGPAAAATCASASVAASDDLSSLMAALLDAADAALQAKRQIERVFEL